MNTEQIESLQQKLNEAEVKLKESAEKLAAANSKLEELDKKLQSAGTEKSKIEQCLKVTCLTKTGGNQSLKLKKYLDIIMVLLYTVVKIGQARCCCHSNKISQGAP